MRAAKLFTFLTLISLVGVFIAPGEVSSAHRDVWVHDRYFVISALPTAQLLLLYTAITGANFALLYYAPARCWNVQWNRVLSLVHFLSFAVSALLFVAVALVAEFTAASERSMATLAVLAMLSAFSFVVSCIVLAVNLVSTAVRTLRVHYAHR